MLVEAYIALAAIIALVILGTLAWANREYQEARRHQRLRDRGLAG
jgi:hypothetical protein